ncbi:neutral zinc metallopeptidase [Pseudonocardia hispaniensis]|uniref:Neutral zinc metallopeptidase n=1 Tax=Pseudonocardia hispaniensis TaxID=904933 RepID=A0ABW1J6W9_9PSEU
MRTAGGSGTRRAPRATGWRVRLAVIAFLATLLAGCAHDVPGHPGAAAPAVPATAGPGSDTRPSDESDPPSPRSTEEITTLAVAALGDYWRAAFPASFGRPWAPIRVFAPVHPGDPAAAAPPCVHGATELDGRAFYCPAADAVVWDAENLLPRLHRNVGPAAVAVVLAHEIGHAIQNRLGVDEARHTEPERYPTILLEAMADCYAGAALRHLADAAPVAVLPIGPLERDAALLALVEFRDPLGTEPVDDIAHGNAFDRVSAFQDGYADGPVRCAEMTVDNRQFTQRRFGSAADRARGGDLPMPQLLTAISGDARGWFGAVVAGHDPAAGWQAPALETDPGATACDEAALRAQGPARFCAADGAVVVDRAALAPLQRRFGDFAGATLIASRYGLAALAAMAEPTTGASAGRTAVCLAGAYTGRLIDPSGTFGLSPGDLDEAIGVLLAADWAERDAAGEIEPAEHGYERVLRFRTGLLAGPAGCGT